MSAYRSQSVLRKGEMPVCASMGAYDLPIFCFLFPASCSVEEGIHEGCGVKRKDVLELLSDAGVANGKA